MPGVIKTNLWDSMPAERREGLYQHMAGSLPVKKVGEAEDVALGFIYLMKQQYGTGKSLVIDGGGALV